MRTDYEATYHNVEDAHWWFRGRRDMILRLLETTPRDAAVLEVGCSGGPLLLELRDKGFANVWGLDVSSVAVALAQKRGLTNVKEADAASTGFEAEKFDVVIASDILEHIQDDGGALREWRRILKPGGRLILFVPAHMFLWSAHDEANQHLRRYGRAEILQLVLENGFVVERSSFWNFTLFLPILGARLFLKLLSKRAAGRGHQLGKVNRFLNAAMGKLLVLENAYIARGFSFPIGVSFFILGHRQ